MTNDRRHLTSCRSLPVLAGISVLVCAAGTLGCSKPGPMIAPVTGVVTLDGAPLSIGVVGFVSATGYTSSAPLGEDGRFKLISQYGEGIPLGTYRVTVAIQSPAPTAESMTPQPQGPVVAIPLRYQYPDRSGLSAAVEDRPNEFSFELVSKG